MVIWLIWYFTGGPQRSDQVKPYLRYNYDNNTIYKSNTDLESGAKEMINAKNSINAINESGNIIEENLNNSNFTQEEY